jgi:hypothetical protein
MRVRIAAVTSVTGSPCSLQCVSPACRYGSVHASTYVHVQRLTVKFANSLPCASCRGNSGQKSQYGLMTLAYQRFTAVLLLIYVSFFLSELWGAVARMSERM